MKPEWNITAEPTAENVAAILADLERCTDVPPSAVVALRGYIASLQGRLEGYPVVGHEALTVNVDSGHYTRRQAVIVQTWACVECGKVWTRETLPGNSPRYCPPDDDGRPSACYRAGRRRITAKSRARKRREEDDVSSRF
jgi:hypothetical protein